MAEVKLKGIRRESVGKGSARRSRGAGKVPAILYGRGMEPVALEVDRREFVKVDRTQAIEVEVPVHLVGEAPGAKEGGVLEHPLFSAHVRCLPTDVPEAIEADISGLAIGDALRVGDLPANDRYEILNDPDSVVASVAAPISEEELEAMEAEAGIEQEPSEAELEAAAAEAEAAPEEGEEPSEGEEESSEED